MGKAAVSGCTVSGTVQLYGHTFIKIAVLSVKLQESPTKHVLKFGF
jgi:hypothetical protein